MVEPEETRPLLNEHSEGAAINYIVTEASPLNSSSSKLHSRTKSAPKKDIGTLDSFVYILIQMYGYGVLALPVIYQQGANQQLNNFFLCYSASFEIQSASSWQHWP